MSVKQIYENDLWLEPFKYAIIARHERIKTAARKLKKNAGVSADSGIADAANNHLFYGLHKTAEGDWIFREWAPNANGIYLLGEFNNWKRSESYKLSPIGGGNWELKLPGHVSPSRRPL